MLSDALLATNRFVLPLPPAQVGVLTCYAAQAFIVMARCVRLAGRAPAAGQQASGCRVRAA